MPSKIRGLRRLPSTLMLLATLLSGLAMSCGGSHTTMQIMGPRYPARPTDCAITFSRSRPPQGKFSVIGKIETHVRVNRIVTAQDLARGKGLDELRRRGCQLGGEYIVLEDFMETAAGEDKHIHIWALVLRRSR